MSISNISKIGYSDYHLKPQVAPKRTESAPTRCSI